MNKEISDSVGEFFSSYVWLKDTNTSHYERNLDFLSDLNVPEGRRLYVSRHTPTVIALLSKSQLEAVISDSRVDGVSEYKFEKPSKCSVDPLLVQIGAGIGSPLLDFSGNGQSIGVISAENLTYDPDALSLSGTNIIDIPTLLPPKKDAHPTAVISQIAGQNVTVNGTEYYGVVKNVSVVFASTQTIAGVYRAVEEMINRGIRIINYSAGIIKGGYSDFDRQIDRLIQYGDILFVTVSGNSLSPASPGLAENAITVGNLKTKSYPDTPLVPPWEVWCFAEDDCSGFTASGVRKPDLVAPGAWIGYVQADGSVNFNNFGTSFACPWVSGIAVAVTEALNRRVSYLSVKGILLMSCNEGSVSDNGNPKIGEYVSLRSGYGAVDGEKAVDTALRCKIWESRLEGEYNIELDGGTYEIMLTFERNGSNARIVFEGEEVSSNGENTLLIKRRSAESVSPLSVIGTGGGRFSLTVLRQA